jgi:hypothetical protein
MKTKIGNGDPVHTFPVHAISEYDSVLPFVLVAVLAKLEWCVDLCLRTETDQFQPLV